MNTEIEAKFLDIDANAIRAKLREVGAACSYPERLMKRKVFDYPDLRLTHSGRWIRVRNEGDIITMSFKQLNDRTLHGTKEVMMIVDSFDAACEFLVSIGLEQKSYQETKREKWMLGTAEITIDTWPWIPTFLEVEAPTEDAVKNTAAALGLTWEDAVFGSAENAYQKRYYVTEEELDTFPEYLFEKSCPWKKK